MVLTLDQGLIIGHRRGWKVMEGHRKSFPIIIFKFLVKKAIGWLVGWRVGGM